MPNFSQKAQKNAGAAALLRRQATPSALSAVHFREAESFLGIRTFASRRDFCQRELLRQTKLFSNPTCAQSRLCDSRIIPTAKTLAGNRKECLRKGFAKKQHPKETKTFSDKIASNQTFVSRRFFPTIKIIRQAKLREQSKPRKRSFFLQPMFFRR